MNELYYTRIEVSFNLSLEHTHTHTHIYIIIVGKSMPIDNYEQYKRVINKITGRLYIYIY